MKIELKEFGRLDKVLSSALQVPRNQVETLIKKTGVKIDGKSINKPSHKIEQNCIVEFDIEENIESNSHEIDFDVEVLYEDDDILVVNKQPFLVVHPAPSVKEATLVDWLIQKGINLSTLSGETRHGIVHRIDKETSGALVIAKNNESHQKLSMQLENRQMGRYYLALIDSPLKDDFIVEKPIARNPKNRLKMAIIEDGRYAKSAFSKLQVDKKDESELIACKLFTGRTHQIRVHLSSIGKHIMGDDLYGFKSKYYKIERVMLHAYLLYLKHPKTDKMLYIKAPLFDDFKQLLDDRFDKKGIYEKIDSDCIVSSFDGMDKWLSR